MGNKSEGMSFRQNAGKSERMSFRRNAASSGRMFFKLNATQLKWIAVVTMLIDHMTVCFLERIKVRGGWTLASSSDALYWLDRMGRAVGRQAFPIFAFFIVEGFFYTRSRWKYLGRLALFALISEEPFRLLNYTGLIGEMLRRSINVYATLAMGLAAIWAVDVIFVRQYLHRGAVSGVSDPAWNGGKNKLALRGLISAGVVAGICWCAWKLNTDYDYIGIMAIVIFYCFHEMFPVHSWRPYAALTVWVWMGCNNAYEWFALPAFLLLAFCYNGERGGSVRHKTAEKYFFYAFYPAHLLILWGIRRLVVGY